MLFFPRTEEVLVWNTKRPFWCFESTLALYLRLPGNIQGAGKDNDILCWYKCKKHIIFLSGCLREKEHSHKQKPLSRAVKKMIQEINEKEIRGKRQLFPHKAGELKRSPEKGDECLATPHSAAP